jgi:hypothetical protein
MVARSRATRLWRESDRTKPATPRAHFWVRPEPGRATMRAMAKKGKKAQAKPGEERTCTRGYPRWATSGWR